MKELRLSGHRIEDIKKIMITEDSKGSPWSLVVDEYWPLEELIKVLIKHDNDPRDDYGNLYEITVDLQDIQEYKSVDGCLVEKRIL